MTASIRCSLVLILLFLTSMAGAADLASHVNPMIGTVPGSGNTYPGAQFPFGMVSLSPHTIDPSPVGYNYGNNRFVGFGLVHSSGVGCGATSEIPFLPCLGEVKGTPVGDRKAYSAKFRHEDEVAQPGYYSVELGGGLFCEVSATARAGIAHFRFPSDHRANVIFNPTNNANGVQDGSLTIDPQERTMSGWIKSGKFCGCNDNQYTTYFFARFDQPFMEYGTWTGKQQHAGAPLAEGKKIAAYLRFNSAESQSVRMKVGISFVSAENAKLNVDTEIPQWNFEAVKSAARAEWNRALEKITVEGGSQNNTTVFYTALYHALMLPSIFEDVNGEYRGMDDEVHKVVKGHHNLSTFSGWDTYRTQAQFWGLLYPEMASDFCTSLHAMALETKRDGGGGFPLWSLLNDETCIMVGYPAAPYICSAYAFGARDFDKQAMLKTLIDSATNQRFCGRNHHYAWDHLPEYKELGFVPADITGDAVSKTVEFAVADFAIAQYCKSLGDDEHYRYFLERSQGVFKLFHPEHRSIQRRDKNGGWMEPFDRYAMDGFAEGNSAHYTWTVTHGIPKTIALIGKEESEQRLDELTSKIARGYDYKSQYYEAGNEPCFSIMPVYNWLQKPWKAQQRTRMVLKECFANTPGGIPGDDDSGAMSAWYLFMTLGLYPELPGVGGFTVLSPVFPKAELHLPNGKTVTILAENAPAKYVQSLKIDDKPSSSLWIPLDRLSNGATLKFEMGQQPNESWGSAVEDAPPKMEP